MNPLFVLALALVAWELQSRRLFGGVRLALPRFAPRFTGLGAALLVAAFAAQIALSFYQAGHDGPRPAWLGQAPIRLVSDAYAFGANHLWFSVAAVLVVALQTAALLLIVGTVADGRSRFATSVGWAALGALVLLSMTSPVVTSFDLFGYVGIGMLKWQPFARPAAFFSGEFARVFDHYPLRPTIYGPVWIATNALVVASGTTFLGKIIALRLFGVMVVAALIATLRALGAGRAVLWIVALNPMLWWQFVADAHNDLFAVVLIAGALLAVERRVLWLAIILVAAAGAVKLPFVVLGLVVFGRAETRRATVICALLSLALAVGISALAGRPYLDALLSTAQGRHVWDPASTAGRIVVVVVAFAALGMALARKRWIGFAGWLFPGFAPVLFPWYLVWSLPYVVAVGDGIVETLIALPLVATLADPIYALDAVSLLAASGAVVYVIVATLRRRPAVAPG